MDNELTVSDNVQKRIRDVCENAGVPYCDVLCRRQNEKFFRYMYGENVTGKEQLQMYSCSKPVTAVAAMLLLERGLIHLEDAAEKYLPQLSECFLVDRFGQKVAPKTKMTLRHLLTMSAGFTYDVKTEPIRKMQANNENADLKDFISAFVKSPLSFEPGSRFQYGLCYDVLAAIIEVVAKMKFSEFVKENIFCPLGMKNSFFDNRKSDVYKMYKADKNGAITRIDNDNFLVLTERYESGGAGLVSTVEDYSEFADFLARGGVNADGKRIIDEKYIRLLASEQINDIAVENTFTCVQGKDYDYGFGVRVRKKATEWGLPRGEYGWDGAAGSYLMVDPVNKISVVIGMNVMEWPYVFTGKHLEIVRAIYERYIL